MSFELIVEHIKENARYNEVKNLVEKQKGLVQTIKEGLFMNSKLAIEEEVEYLILKNFVKYLKKKGDDCFAEELQKEVDRKKNASKEWDESVKKEMKLLKGVIETLFSHKN